MMGMLFFVGDFSFQIGKKIMLSCFLIPKFLEIKINFFQMLHDVPIGTKKIK
jgi:hypothetical protein